MWNTVTVQYNPLIEEEFDEHFKVTCEYGYDFWKTVTFPFLDVEYVFLVNIKQIQIFYYLKGQNNQIFHFAFFNLQTMTTMLLAIQNILIFDLFAKQVLNLLKL